VDRRNFMRVMLGVAAATALPSEVWPFRKIFLPPAPTIYHGDLAAITALELEEFAKSIPDLVFRHDPIYNLFKKVEYPGRLPEERRIVLA